MGPSCRAERGAYFTHMTRYTTTSLLAFLMLAACGDEEAPTDPVGATVLRSEMARITSPDVPATDIDAVAEGNRAFAFDLYSELRDEDGNLFMSPYSISVALAMTYAGAEGNTETQMRDVMHFIDEARLHPALNATDLALMSRGDEASGSDDGPFRLNVVNATWGQTGYTFLPSYLDVLGENYGAPMYLLDFSSDPEGSRMVINDWVEERTENRIQELIPMGVITPITTLVLTNAIYFNAAWNQPFEESNTDDGAFTRLDGNTVTVPMMFQDEEHRYAEGEGYRVVELAYDEPDLAMVLVLPDEGRFDEIEAGLNETTYQTIMSELSDYRVAVTMPKFEYESAFGLNDALMALGMTDAFSGAADFSGMDGTHTLFIQSVLHKAFIAVNEAGTEAAAATAVVVGRVSAPEPAEIALDRPFLYFIVDRPTGELLFLGRVLESVCLTGNG